MIPIIILGHCPNRVIHKAHFLLSTSETLHKVSKKLSGIKRYSSIKINTNFRVLLSNNGKVFLCSHKHYEKKIKNLKRIGA
jgi:hypothetical protein